MFTPAHRLLVSLVVVAAATFVVADEHHAKPAAAGSKDPNAALFEKLKGMAGDWVADQDTEHGKKGDLVSRISLTGGGSAVTEVMMPGSNMEMLSVYHRDGADILMTHYCMLGNQPRMRVKQGKDSNEIVFEFVGGTNLKADKDPHIHSGRLRWIDADHVHSDWDFYKDGKLAGTHSFDMSRKTK